MSKSATSTQRYRPEKERAGVALCLSGGGFRAALFHAGALRRLNEAGVLGKVTTITSVSGGSIASGLLARLWPRLELRGGVIANFSLYEDALAEFCARDLRTGPLLWRRLNPLDWPRLLGPDRSATDLLREAYEARLTTGLTLGDLPAKGAPGRPAFVFCASNLQTGASFELSAARVGDYQLGYTRMPELPVSFAVAASSAFPIAFPPLVLTPDPARHVFERGDQPPERLARLRARIVLSDGGVYDNMGLEPVWKSHAVVLVSDGGKPFQVRPGPGAWIVPRLLRAQDVIGNQALAVRKRWLMASFLDDAYGGAYWGIGADVADYPVRPAWKPGYRGEVLERLREVRTDLDVFTPGEQRVLRNHGWVLADAGVRSFCQALTGPEVPDGEPPDRRLLEEPAGALTALGGGRGATTSPAAPSAAASRGPPS